MSVMTWIDWLKQLTHVRRDWRNWLKTTETRCDMDRSKQLKYVSHDTDKSKQLKHISTLLALTFFGQSILTIFDKIR